MPIKFLLSIVLFCFFTLVKGQIMVVSDADSLSLLPFKNYLKSGTKGLLKGPGKTLEIHSNEPSNKYYFETEHHTAWFKFIIPISGELVINITPYKKAEDLDFLVFKFDGQDFQKQLMSKAIQPVRSNMSRGDSTQLGITGLSLKGVHEFEAQGPGNNFSTPIKVNKGETFYLVVDNVHNENGFMLELGIQNEIQLSGLTINDNNQPVSTEITVIDQNGNQIAEEKSNKKGEFDFNVKVWENTNNILTAEADSSFFYNTIINTKTEKDHKYTELSFVLPKLKKGKKYDVGILNFVPESPVLLPNCQISLDALYKLMKKNPTLKIRIEGHVNDWTHTHDEKKSQDLSENRSKTVYDFLVWKGIDPDRLEKIGFGGKFPLFAYPRNEEQESRNRRVEINVLEY